MNVETALVKANNISVYESDIELVTADYIQSLPDESMIYKSAVFSGLLDNIYKRLLKPIITKDYGKTNSSYNYDILDNIFESIFIPLCCKYNITPTVLSFSVLCHVNNKTISSNKSGLHSDGSKVNQKTVGIIQKWYDTCENGLLNKAIADNSIGSIFALKSVYSYSDQQTIRLETAQTDSHETAEQIAAKHSNAMIPQKPDLSDNLND